MQNNSKPKILIAEDGDEFRDALIGYLQGKKFDVIGAPNGKIAKDLIPISGIQLLITDIQMPFVDGIELLTWVKEKYPMPVIVMTGFSHLLKTKTAAELGADGFLAKPFDAKNLVELLNSIIAPTKEQVPLNTISASRDADFCKVAISEFISMPKLAFDVYIRLSAEKYIKLGNQGTEIPQSQVSNYKSKGIKFLHIKKIDFSKLIDFNAIIGKKIIQSQNISKEKKANFLKYSGEVILEKCFVAGFDKELFESAVAFTNLNLFAISNDENFVDILASLNSHSDDLYAHSLGVSMYSILIAQALGWESSQTLFKLGLAGILHDIGKKEIDRSILDKARALLTQEERRLIESHVLRGKEILESISGISSDIIRAVFEHHERANGQGYPRNISTREMSPFGKILSVADCFVKRALKGPHSEGLTAAEAIKAMDALDADQLDQQIYTALKNSIISAA